MLDNVIPQVFYEDVSIGIDLINAEISARRPDLLHPHLPEVTLREWNARELAVLDRTTVCVVFGSWT